MLLRLETMVLMGAELPLSAIRSQIASAIDILIHLGRLRDRSRRVLEIAEVTGIEHGEITLHPLFQFRERKEEKGKENEGVRGCLEKVGELQDRQKLELAGEKL